VVDFTVVTVASSADRPEAINAVDNRMMVATIATVSLFRSMRVRSM